VGATTDPVIRPDQIRQNSSAAMENDRNNLSMSDLVLDLSDSAERTEAGDVHHLTFLIWQNKTDGETSKSCK
jgi:hypothetical protein